MTKVHTLSVRLRHWTTVSLAAVYEDGEVAAREVLTSGGMEPFTLGSFRFRN